MVTPTLPSTVNIAAYKFVPLDDLQRRRADLKRLSASLELKGTILLSPEGINLFMDGGRESVDRLVVFLRSDWGLTDLEVKESLSSSQPFNRLLVKIKQEIIAFGIDGIEPAKFTSPKLKAAQLRQWLDEGRPVRLLDVRNEYEVDLGTFRGAERLGISHFRNFPEAVGRLPQEAKHQPVVMFCTGGIRCEKAGPLMHDLGFEEVYQLDGGILKYFEECGGEHYDGACFVFDGRVALDPQLQPTGLVTCYACQAVLNHEDLQSPKYQFGTSCPYCFRSTEQRQADRLAARNAMLRRVANPLPGSVPYDNVRKMHVARKYAGTTVMEFLSAYHAQTPHESWCDWISAGEITTGGRTVTADEIVSEGQTLTQIMPNTVEPFVNAGIDIVYEDDSLVIVNKPAPLPVHPSGRFNRNTLHHLLSQIYRPEKIRFAHRLDANTTGLIIVCRKRAIAKFIQPQFEQQQVEKTYLAKIVGSPTWDRIECTAPIGIEPTRLGGREIASSDGLGQSASTEFAVRRRFANNTTLVEARPRTGRTHQIRLHLSHLGYPIVGDTLYRQTQALINDDDDAVLAQPLCLHAWKLRFIHPESRQPVEFTASLPAWV